MIEDNNNAKVIWNYVRERRYLEAVDTFKSLESSGDLSDAILCAAMSAYGGLRMPSKARVNISIVLKS